MAVVDHPELLEPPKFKFRVIRTFQDPLTRQLAEAVRIERSGEGILNSRSEFNRCRVPRLKINLEEWGMNKDPERKKEKVDEYLEKEAEDSLENKTPIKRKPEDIPKGRRAKKLKFEKLEGWGEEPVTIRTEQEDMETGSVKDTLESDRSPGVGTSPGWKSSQGGTTIRTTDSRGARELSHTLPEGWKDSTGSDDNYKGSEVREESVNALTASMRNTVNDKEDETIPEDKPTKAEDNIISEEHFEGEEGVNTPTASMRNIVNHVQTGKEDKTLLEGWKTSSEEETFSEDLAKGGRGVYTPTASMRNIVKPTAVTKGWKIESMKTAKTATPANKRRVRGKLSKSEIVEMKKSYHNIEEMLKMKKQIPPEITIKVTEPDKPLGPSDVQPVGRLRTGSALHSDQTCSSVHPHYSPETPLCTRDRGVGIMQHITARGQTDMRKAASPSTTPGGTIIFKEKDIRGVEEMIRRWEELEESEQEVNESRKGSGGRRVSELSKLFEEGGEDKGHINVTGGGSKFQNLRGHSSKLSTENLKNPHSASKIDRNIDIFKIYRQPKQSFPSPTNSHYRRDTESGVERDWSSLTNQRQADVTRQKGN